MAYVGMPLNEAVIKAVQQLGEAMKTKRNGRVQRWSWDEVESYLGGAIAVWSGADGHTIVELLRGHK